MGPKRDRFLRVSSFDDAYLRGFTALYTTLMLDPSGLSNPRREMAVFVEKLTRMPYYTLQIDCQSLSETGFSDRDIWDIASIASFFNISNQVDSAVHLMPNPEYHVSKRRLIGGLIRNDRP
jgi:alkylhydroperoxidase family enzyme